MSYCLIKNAFSRVGFGEGMLFGSEKRARPEKKSPIHLGQTGKTGQQGEQGGEERGREHHAPIHIAENGSGAEGGGCGLRERLQGAHGGGAKPSHEMSQINHLPS